MPPQPKLKLALYWAASCGGCEIAIVELREKILIVDEVADILFWPWPWTSSTKTSRRCRMGTSTSACSTAPSAPARTSTWPTCCAGSRRCWWRSVCAYEGCIPGLANLYDRQSIFECVYRESPSVDNPNKIVPQQVYPMPEGEIQIPKFYNTVKTLDQGPWMWTTSCPAVRPRTRRSGR